MKKEENIRRLKGSIALLSSASILAMATPALAQDTESDSSALEEDVIIVSGISKSLAASSDVKRQARGVVDALTAEDIGDFPDTNLAESLQRITGVSIDRRNGEGSQVTVRGFGPDFNLVLLNGRQMPTAFNEGDTAPASRSFDFGNLAAEGISGIRVYKTGRASLPTGGVGSTLNILTARPFDSPGLRFSIGAKAVVDNSDTSLDDGSSVTPEFSGIFSNTFMDDKVGITVTGSYQDRESGVAQFGTTSGWRGAYLGSTINEWGVLPPASSGQVTNRPEGDQIYSVPQNANYQLSSIDRERINGQVSLQYKPIETVTATLDYFYSENTVEIERSDLSVWFNHGNTTSAFGDGSIADILFYNEDFGDGGSDLSMGASQVATKNENRSLGFNVEWEVNERLTLEIDAHSSTAESNPDSPYGSAGVVSTADFALRSQGLDFTTELPSLSLGFQSPFTDISEDRMVATGSTFQAASIETDIDQVQLFANYQLDNRFVQSIDFGVSYTKNEYRGTFFNNQRDSWGGVGTPDDYPDDIWTRADLAGNFDAFGGSNSTFQDFFIVDFEQLVATLDQPIGSFDAICGGDGVCTNDGSVQTDRRSEEESIAAFIELSTEFDLGPFPASIIGGVRYEQTDVTSEALVNVPIGSQWVADNEFGLIFGPDRTFTELEGDYDYWLPAVDFQVEPYQDVVLRASYSHTMTRQSYSDIQGGIVADPLFRVDGGEAGAGNPALLPLLSKNIDVSAEYYYSEGSYISAGFFWKEVDNFAATDVTVGNVLFDNIATPIDGARYAAAVDALGTTDSAAVRQWIFENADPSTFEITGTNSSNGNFTGNIFGVPGEDPALGFRLAQPFNSDSKSVDGWEFAWQHILGDTGFGWIVNYTIVDGDLTFDNDTVPAFANQPSEGSGLTPLVGLSDTFNIIGFYDKNGIEARLAYNWRDEFLSSDIGVSGTPTNPLYVQEYGQLDFNV
ncbi:MAG: TonB-dependent receptor, partial [Pseudomonadota bacterium]